MKTYTKTHTLEAAAKSHMKNIRGRKGTASMSKVGKKFKVEYSFPDVKPAKKAAKKSAKKKKR